MLKVNEYFEGKVMSMAFENEEGRATLGLMAAGDYEFGTSTIEYMTVVSGAMKVLLPGTQDWQLFEAGSTFIVPKDSRFKLHIEADAAYKCVYK